MFTRFGVVALGVLIVTAVAATWLAQSWRYEAFIATKDKDQALAVAQAYEQVRLIEKRQQAAMEVIQHDATLQIMQIQSDADIANDTAERLRKELARYRANTTNTCATTGGEAAQDPVGVLIGVLEGLESAGREIAEYADRARIAGEACEKAYDIMQKSPG